MKYAEKLGFWIYTIFVVMITLTIVTSLDISVNNENELNVDELYNCVENLINERDNLKELMRDVSVIAGDGVYSGNYETMHSSLEEIESLGFKADQYSYKCLYY